MVYQLRKRHVPCFKNTFPVVRLILLYWDWLFIQMNPTKWQLKMVCYYNLDTLLFTIPSYILLSFLF